MMTFCFNQIPFYLNESEFGEANNDEESPIDGFANFFGWSVKWTNISCCALLYNCKRAVESRFERLFL